MTSTHPLRQTRLEWPHVGGYSLAVTALLTAITVLGFGFLAPAEETIQCGAEVSIEACEVLE